jgi:hypothetical protein
MPADRWDLTEYLIKKMEMKDEPDLIQMPVKNEITDEKMRLGD